MEKSFPPKNPTSLAGILLKNYHIIDLETFPHEVGYYEPANIEQLPVLF